jgi:acyl carrier protein
MSVRAEIEQFIRENFIFGEVALAPETSFVEGGILDSTSVLELVAFLEERFGIEVAPEEINLENMDSLSRVEAYVRRKQALAEA